MNLNEESNKTDQDEVEDRNSISIITQEHIKISKKTEIK